MANDNNDVVIMNLDRPRVLKFGHTALKMLVALSGKSLEEIDSNIDIGNFELLEQMAYCGLAKDAIQDSEPFTLERAVELLDEAPSFIHEVEKIFNAYRLAFGQTQVTEGNQEPAEKPAKANPSTGKKA